MELISIDGLNIQYHQKSKRIINIELDDKIIEKLAFNFKKFDILTLEYKPFSIYYCKCLRRSYIQKTQ